MNLPQKATRLILLGLSRDGRARPTHVALHGIQQDFLIRKSSLPKCLTETLSLIFGLTLMFPGIHPSTKD